MQWLRTITRFVRVLVALFVVAQFAGVVASPLASAHGTPLVFHVHHAHDHGDKGTFHHHGDQSKNGADHCCALHAFFAGVLPPPIVVETMEVVSQRLTSEMTDLGPGVDPGQLDRPPRPLL